MKEKIAELIKERNNRIDSIYTEINTIQDEYHKQLKELLPYEGKYIKIKCYNHYDRYFKVTSIVVDGMNDKFRIHGKFITGDISTPYDEKFVKFDDYQTVEYDLRDIEKIVNGIEIITKEEFINAYRNLVEGIEKHLIEDLDD
jgi:hypothetical protein